MFQVVLLNHVTWKPLLELYLEPVIKENYLNKVYEERVIQPKVSNKNTNFYDKHIRKSCLKGFYTGCLYFSPPQNRIVNVNNKIDIYSGRKIGTANKYKNRKEE